MKGRHGVAWGPGVAVLLATLSGLLTPRGTAGQTQPGDTVPSDSTVLTHPAVVVRALRTPSAEGVLPFAVTVRRLAAAVPGGGSSLDDALRTVPGLQVDNRHNDALGDRIVLRGFGARAQFGIRGVQILVDGIPATMPDGQATLNHVDVGLLERAEVLRGPAAASYGNGAGGVLLLTTAPPPAAPFRQEASVTAGEDGLLRLRSISGGRPGAAAWASALSRSWQDGFRPHSGADRWHWTGRFEAPAAGGELRLVAHGVAYDADNPGALTGDQLAEDPGQAQGFNVAQRTGETGRHGQAGAWWGRPVAGARLEAVAWALDRRVDNPIPPAIIDLERRAGGIRVLVRSDGPLDAERGIAAPGAFSWAAGVDAGLQGDDRRTFENEAGERGAMTLDQTERVTNVALHGQAFVPLPGPAALFLGARYDRVGFWADDRLVTGDNPDDSGRRTMDAFSPMAGVRLAVSPAVALFGNVATAFETPTTTELVNRPDGAGGFNQALEPQRTTSVELGGRARVGERLRIQASAYHARVRDALVPFEVASAPGRQYYRNAAGAVHRGVELVAELRAGPLEATASLDRIHAAYSDYATEGDTHDGRRVPGIRPWTVEARVMARPWARAALQLDYRATGEMAADDANEAWAEGYHLVGLRLSAPARAGALDVELIGGVDNLLDRAYVASVVPNAFGGRFFEPGPGRALYLGVRTGWSAGAR